MNLWPGSSILIICAVVALGLQGPSVDASSSSPGVNSTPSPPVLFHYTSQLVTAYDLTPSERNNIINLSDEPLLASKNISLLRCSLYRFTFTFHNQNQLTTETRIIRTPKPDPKSQIEVTSPSGHAIELIWTTNYPECVGHYTIDVREPSQRRSQSHLKVTNVSSYEVTELIPCTDYSITLITYDAGGKKRTDQSTATERTTLANIVLQDFQFFVVSPSTIRFNWTKLPEVSRCDGDYFIKLIPADETYSVVLEEHVPYSENEITMSIKACRRYNVTLNANYFDVVASLQDFKSPFANPSNIYGLTVDAQKLILMWQNPVDNSNCVAYYMVSAGGTQFRVETNQLSLIDFQRCQTHFVSVQLTPESLEEKLVYEPLQLDFVLDADVLDAEISPELVLNSREHTLTVTWSNPKLMSQCSIKYDLKWNSEAIPKIEGTVKNSYVINEIEYCQSHSLEIQRRYKRRTRTTRKDVYFPGDSAQSVVNISSEYNLETDEYILSWNKPRGFRACNFSYLIETSQFQTQVDDENYAIVWENEIINVEISIVHEFGGRSSPSKFTLNAPFPPVTNVKHKNLDDGQTTISWSKPETAQKIKKYIVIWDNEMVEVEKTSLTATFPKCTPIEVVVYVDYMGQSSVNTTYTFSYNMAPEPVVDVSHSFKNPNYILTWSPSDINVNCYTYFVITPSSSLDPVVVVPGRYEHHFSTWADDTEYTFEITAYFDKDLKSSPAQHTITTPGSVRDFTITANAQGTADLQWAVLYNEDHRAVDFVITLQEESHTTQQTKITLAVPFCIDLEIAVQVNYQTEVTRTANFHNQRLIKVPGPVRGLRLIPYVDTILVRWNAPDEYPECAASYKVQVTGMDLQIVTNTKFEIPLIESCQLLSVRVSAQNVESVSGPETTKDFTTAEGHISEVTNLSVEATEKTLKLVWEVPLKGKLCVTSYRVRVWVAGSLESIHEATTENTFLIVEDMNACQKVEVQIVPLGQNSDEGESVQNQIEMKERAPGQLTPLQPVDIYSRGLKLRTTLEDPHYFCPLSVLQVTCRDSADAMKTVYLELKQVVPKISTSFEIAVEDLEPYEQYICTAMVKNNFGSWSAASYDVPFTTLEDLSGPPMDLRIVDWSPERFLFVWTDPLKPNGRITHYKVFVNELEPLYYVPAHCRDEVPQRVVIDSTAVLREFVAVVKPYTKYELSVKGVNGAGDGQSVTIIGVTSPSVPNPPRTLEVSSVEGNFLPNEYNGTVKISWMFPCFTQGPFELFHGTLEGTHQGAEGDTSVAFTESGQRDMYEVEMTNLMASYIYEVQLTCATTEFNSTPISIHFRAPAAIPDFMSIHELVWEMTLNPSQGAVLFIRKSDLLRSGELLYYSIMISEMDCQPEPEVLWSSLDVMHNWPNENCWYDVQKDVCQRQYQATPERLSIGLDDRSADASENLEIPIGGDICPEVKEGTRQYCNGPLKAGTRYAVVLRAFSESGYTDNPFVVLETISEIRLVLIVLSLIAVLSCAFLLGIFIVLRKRHDSSEHDTHGDALKKKSICGAGEILTKNFPVHFEDLSKNNCERLNGEFHLVSSVGQGQSTECATAKENGSKNRYTNVLPYDFNRVILEKPEEDPSGDYINASFIDGFRKARDYIASQGPKMDSSHDFWWMILQFKVSSIVMLTSYREGDKDKCHEYFPAKVSETLQFSDITIKCQRETDFPTHKKRIFVIEKNQISHTVKHYHFLKWPDHSACDPNDLIAFTNTVSVERKNPSHPLVVHCSAGVGRTGTFIALDISLQQMKAEKKINVLETVKDLRRQRMKMVQSFSQYLLIYQCLVIIMKQYETSQSDPIWKRLSRKSNLTGGSGKGRFYNGGASMVHNFGMLPPMKELAGSSQEPTPPYISAAELLGNHNESREVSEEFMRDGIPMEKYENSSCFEPDDSIT